MIAQADGKKRVVIENIKPSIDAGRFSIKRVVGEKVVVTADIFADGHDVLAASVLYRKQEEKSWREAPAQSIENDRWRAEFIVDEVGIYRYFIQGRIDHFGTWQLDLKKRLQAGSVFAADMLIGARYIEEASARASGEDRRRLTEFGALLGNAGQVVDSPAFSQELSALMSKYADRTSTVTSEPELEVIVDERKALFSSWYELFPRSCAPVEGRHGTFKDCERLLPEIARMGFDTLYLPPIHPIGKTNRKGRNNSLEVRPDDVGSPWAIGADEGGHKSVHPQLGTVEDFEGLITNAKEHGIDVAMDLAFQCSPDHPYVKEHPGWFSWRPDGTIQYAENPPKRYEDIVHFNFESDDWQALWEELKSIVLFWIGKGVRIFRVDNPHTKPFSFWEWLIQEIKRARPDVIFFCEAFTRPKVMYRLAKAGFSQSYTYFTWRNTRSELTEYLTALTQTDEEEYFRPNFWPNTPDILTEYLQYGGRSAFTIRLVLAATLASNYGIYGPAFELCVSDAMPGTEEYLNSEKYELRHWDRDAPGNLKDFIARVNRIRRENPALQKTSKLAFHAVTNEYLLFYTKTTDDLEDIILVVVNLDPFHTQSGWLSVPLAQLEIDPLRPFLVHNLLSDDKYIWQGERNFVELNPQFLPANIFRVRKRLKREVDFDYFM
jgi:starch synthase (maltosyl-transferring)